MEVDNILWDKAIRYADGVISGEVITNSNVKKQCLRFKAELDKIENEDYPYTINFKVLKVVETILGLCFFATGEGVKGQKISEGMADFQAFILVNFFGFVHKSDITKRRYKTVILMMGRKSAKTFLSALILMILMIIEEDYAEFFSCSVDSTLSGLVMKELKQIISSSLIADRFDIKAREVSVKNRRYNNPKDKKFYTNLHGDSKRLDGRHPHTVILDECGLYPDNSIVEAMELGMIGWKNSASIYISTAYNNHFETFRNKIKYMEEVLDGEIEDDTAFGLLYKCENEDEWETDRAIYEGCPLAQGNKAIFDYVKKKIAEAIKLGETTSVKTKFLNIWLTEVEGLGYLESEDIKDLWIEGYKFGGRKVVLGLDLSEEHDNTGLTITSYDEELEKYVSKSVAFIPRLNVEEKERIEKIPYSTYSSNGKDWCYATGNKKIDYGFIRNYIGLINQNCKIETLTYDPAFAKDLIEELKDDGIRCDRIDQTHKVLNDGIIYLRGLIYDKKILFEKNPLYRSSMMNAIIKKDSGGRMILNKDKSNGKIDLIASTVNCFTYIYNLKPFGR